MEAHWTAGYQVNEIVTFYGPVEQGPYLDVRAGELGKVVQISETEPAFMGVKLDTPHWQLGPSNVLWFDGESLDILASLRAFSFSGPSDFGGLPE
jgi:hypothetical protein